MKISNSGWYGNYMGNPPDVDDGDYICDCGEWRSDCLGRYFECTKEE